MITQRVAMLRRRAHLLDSLYTLVHKVGHGLLFLLEFGKYVALLVASRVTVWLIAVHAAAADAYLLHAQRLVLRYSLLRRCQLQSWGVELHFQKYWISRQLPSHGVMRTLSSVASASLSLSLLGEFFRRR